MLRSVAHAHESLSTTIINPTHEWLSLAVTYRPQQWWPWHGSGACGSYIVRQYARCKNAFVINVWIYLNGPSPTTLISSPDTLITTGIRQLLDPTSLKENANTRKYIQQEPLECNLAVAFLEKEKLEEEAVPMQKTCLDQQNGPLDLYDW